MKVLLFEYVTGGGLEGEDPSPSLVREAEVMVSALLRDLEGESLLLLRDRRLPLPPVGGACRLQLVGAGEPFPRCWQRALDWADAVWVIAPETAGVLERFSLEVVKAGKLLLGSLPSAVAVAADKQKTLECLGAAGIGCVPSWLCSQFSAQIPPPWIVKPRDGVGGEGVHRRMQLPLAWDGEFLVQPYVEGESLSLSAVFDSGGALFISGNRQVVEEREEKFQLLGCQVSAFSDPAGTWQELCVRVAAALPGLWGYAGIDLILAEEGPLILEINPRLTLSYAGLGRSLGGSLARMILKLAKGEVTLEDLGKWRRGLKIEEVWVGA